MSFNVRRPLVPRSTVSGVTPAIYFNGVDSYVDFDIPSVSAIENLSLGPFTVALLIRPEGAVDPIDRAFSDYGNSVLQSQLYFGGRGPEDPLSSLRLKTSSMADYQGIEEAIYDAAIPSNAGDTPDFVVVARWDGSSPDSKFSVLERGVGGFTHTVSDVGGVSMAAANSDLVNGVFRLGGSYLSAFFEGYIGIYAAWDSYLSDSDVGTLVHTDNTSVYSESWQALSPLHLYHPVSDTSIPDVMGTGMDSVVFSNVIVNPNGFFDVHYTGLPAGGGTVNVNRAFVASATQQTPYARTKGISRAVASSGSGISAYTRTKGFARALVTSGNSLSVYARAKGISRAIAFTHDTTVVFARSRGISRTIAISPHAFNLFIHQKGISRALVTDASASDVFTRLKGFIRALIGLGDGTTPFARTVVGGTANLNRAMVVLADNAVTFARAKGISRAVASSASATSTSSRAKGILRAVITAATGTTTSSRLKGSPRALACSADGTTPYIRVKGFARAAFASVDNLTPFARLLPGSSVSRAMACFGNATSSYARSVGRLRVFLAGVSSAPTDYTNTVGRARALAASANTATPSTRRKGTVAASICTSSGTTVYARRISKTTSMLVTAQGSFVIVRRKGLSRAVAADGQAISTFSFVRGKGDVPGRVYGGEVAGLVVAGHVGELIVTGFVDAPTGGYIE